MQAPITPLICDRCGSDASTGPAGAQRFSFCPSCRFFVCASCWVPERGICRGCAQPGLPKPGGLKQSIRDTLLPEPLPGRLTSNRPPTVPGARGLGLRRVEVVTADREPPRQPEHGILGRALSAAAADLPFRLTIAVIILLAIGAVVWMLNLSGGAQGGAPQTHATASPVVEHAEKAAEAGAGAATSYVVRAGDTLRSIARQLYGDENAWERIYAANRPLIANPDSLVVGTHLSIPPPR